MLSACSPDTEEAPANAATEPSAAAPTSAAPEPPASSSEPAPATTAAPEPPATSEPAPEPAPTHVVATPADTRPFSEPEPIPQNLSYGMESDLVRELQVRLRHAKYLAIIDVTSKFGDQTQNAVINFQRDHGIPTTGTVGQQTWDALLPKSHEPTAEELNNTNVGPWFTGPTHEGYLMEVQHRLSQVGGYSGPIDGQFNQLTKDAIANWRTSQGLASSDVMDERAWQRLLAKSRNPSYADLFAAPPADQGLVHELDARCQVGKVVCISKAQNRLSYVVDGQILLTREARFAMPGWESPVGDYRVWYMNNDTVSNIFGERTPMPYAVFYNRDVAIHFSDNFADMGYESGSHGCTQVKDYQAAKWLYEQLVVGDRVVVY